MLAGQEIAGGMLSTTVMVNEQDVVFPAASVAVWVTVFTPTGNVAPEARPAVRAVVAPEQLSVPTGAVYVTTCPQVPAEALTVMFAGQAMAGEILSTTVMVKEQDVVLPAPSVAVKVTVFTPTGNVAPEAKPTVRAVVTPEQLSVPTGAV